VAFEDQQITYRELNRRANQLAHYLRRLGAEPEMLVGLCVNRSVEWVVGLLGILKSGAAFVAMDPAFPDRRLVHMLKDARAPLVVTSEEQQDRLPGYSGRKVCLGRESSSIALESNQNPVSGVSPAQLAYMVFTSGSTGSPKGVMIEHEGLVNLTLAQIDAYKVLPESRFLQTFSLGFDASIAQVTRPLCAGGTLQLAAQQSLIPGPEMIQLLLETKVSHLNLPPSLLRQLPTEKLPDVKVVIVGGEECSADLVTRWAHGRRFFNAYGPTEATVGSTIYECTANGQSPPIGRPIANKQVYVLDSYLQPVPIGVSGELYIGGIGLARGYWDRPGLTAESFVPNPFSSHPGARMYRTGDLAKFLPNGNIRFLGRMDQQVKIRGFRVELEGIETTLTQHPAVQQAVLAVGEDTPGDQRLTAYFVPSQGAGPAHEDLRHFLQERLPDYMVPSAYVLLDGLPLTANGKLDRNALPPPDWSRSATAHNYVPPRKPIEKVLAEIWTEVLGVEQVGIYDSFFDLGGHSLRATQIISRIEAALRANVPLSSFLRAPTVAQLAQVILAHEPRAGQTEKVAEMLQSIKSMSPQERRARLGQTGMGSNSA
jgi:amino acid adenylation domain-containing protein